MNTETQQSTEVPVEGEQQPVLENNPLQEEQPQTKSEENPIEIKEQTEPVIQQTPKREEAEEPKVEKNLTSAFDHAAVEKSPKTEEKQPALDIIKQIDVSDKKEEVEPIKDQNTENPVVSELNLTNAEEPKTENLENTMEKVPEIVETKEEEAQPEPIVSQEIIDIKPERTLSQEALEITPKVEVIENMVENKPEEDTQIIDTLTAQENTPATEDTQTTHENVENKEDVLPTPVTEQTTEQNEVLLTEENTTIPAQQEERVDRLMKSPSFSNDQDIEEPIRVTPQKHQSPIRERESVSNEAKPTADTQLTLPQVNNLAVNGNTRHKRSDSKASAGNNLESNRTAFHSKKSSVKL